MRPPTYRQRLHEAVKAFWIPQKRYRPSGSPLDHLAPLFPNELRDLTVLHPLALAEPLDK